MPVATPETTPVKKNYKNAIIAALSVALVSTGGYMAYQKTSQPVPSTSKNRTGYPVH